MFLHMVAHKAICHAATLVKGFFDISIDNGTDSAAVGGTFHTE